MFEGRTLTKNDGLTLEMFEKPVFFPDGHLLHSITRFGIVQRMAGRHFFKPEDWYHTGQPRDVAYYSDIGVKKSILIGKSGDVNGEKSVLKFHAVAGGGADAVAGGGGGADGCGPLSLYLNR